MQVLTRLLRLSGAYPKVLIQSHNLMYETNYLVECGLSKLVQHEQLLYSLYCVVKTSVASLHID